MSDLNDQGEILRLLRIANDLSISELARRMSISKSYITEIEKGIKNPSNSILERYSKELNISKKNLDYILKEFSKEHLPYKKLLLSILEKIA